MLRRHFRTHVLKEKVFSIKIAIHWYIIWLHLQTFMLHLIGPSEQSPPLWIFFNYGARGETKLGSTPIFDCHSFLGTCTKFHVIIKICTIFVLRALTICRILHIINSFHYFSLETNTVGCFTFKKILLEFELAMK